MQLTTILHLRDEVASGKHERLSTLYTNCKKLAKEIKARECTVQPTSSEFRAYIPSRQTSDELVDTYLRTGEAIHRILHIPSFQREYERYWERPSSVSSAFVIQLLSVFAIGSFFHHGNSSSYSSQRSVTMHWIHQAQEWLSSPFEEKSRLTMTGIQNHCLILIAREMNAAGADLIWISAGALLRRAMLMGYHRDPTLLPISSMFEIEMRRRLWATILEILLQSCMNSGSPPLISPEDYDCKTPSNINDTQIDNEHELTPIPKPKDYYTQTTLQIALMQTFYARLSIAKLSSGIRTDVPYETVLQLGTQLQQDYSTTVRHLEASRTAQPQITLFQAKLFDLLNLRFFLTLHHKWSHSANSNHTYLFSRKVCIETSLALSSPHAALQSASPESPKGDPDLYRLKLLGGGIYRGVLMQSCMLIVLEFLDQLARDQSLFQRATASMERQELYGAILEHAELSGERVKAGETNVNGFAFTGCLLKQIENIRNGAPPEEGLAGELERNLKSSYVVLKERWVECEGALLACASGDEGQLLDPGDRFWMQFEGGFCGDNMVSSGRALPSKHWV